MFGPDWKAGCPSCSAIADGFNGIAGHLANHDLMLWAVSRAPPNPVTVVTLCSLCAEAKLCVVDKNCRFGQTSKENGDGGYSASSRNQIVPG